MSYTFIENPSIIIQICGTDVNNCVSVSKQNFRNHTTETFLPVLSHLMWELPARIHSYFFVQSVWLSTAVTSQAGRQNKQIFYPGMKYVEIWSSQ